MNLDNLHKAQEKSLPSNNTACDTGERTLSLLQKIQSGAVDPKCIRPAERRLIVSYLMADGYCTADMAQILKVSDRSIERDKKAIRETNALAADPGLVEQMVGRLVCEADLSIQRIRKAAHDKDVPQAVKVDAEYRCYQIASDMVSSLQRLGYLPTATARLKADITHSIDQIPELPQLDMEAQRLMQLTGEIQGTDPRLTEQLTVIRAQIVKVQLADKIQTISKVLEEKGEHDHESEQV